MSSATSESPADSPSSHDRLPRLSRDASFLGMLAAQFLGAFNDNLFKQMVLLLCADYVVAGGAHRESIAAGLFALPFVLFSGIAGWMADRWSKRSIIVWMKAAEIAVMAAGLIAFVRGGATFSSVAESLAAEGGASLGSVDGAEFGARLNFLLAVLFFMGTHSAFFGPSKFGILPEMLRERDLPAANGMVLMTTFVAIIFGMALGGYTKDLFGSRVWIVNALCVGIAIVGTAASLLVRRTPVARPGLQFRLSSLAIDGATWRLLRGDRPLGVVLLVSSLFWFLGGVVQVNANLLGRFVFGMSDSRTSLANACMGVGIAIGCVTAAKLSHRTIHFGLVRVGSWGLVGALAAVAVLGVRVASTPLGEPTGVEPLGRLLFQATPHEWQLRIVMALMGFFAGLFVVPLQVFLQAKPPRDLKGRMIGAMNLVNWIGILLSQAFLHAATWGLNVAHVGAENFGDATIHRNAHWVFAMLAAALLPVALFYRPASVDLE